MTEPPTKRPKLPKMVTIKAILPNDYTEHIGMEKVYVTTVVDKRQISKIMQELATILPLTQLQHLKRVKNNQIITCTQQEVGCQQQLKDFLAGTTIKAEIIDLIVQGIEIVEVPEKPPRLRWQYDKVNRIWPCKFHPDKYMEQRYEGSNFKAAEKDFHLKIGGLLKDLSRKLLNNEAVGICVDPRSNSIVAIACGFPSLSPVMHSTMMLVDYVAKSQDSGAWCQKLNNLEQFLEEEKFSELQKEGIPKRFKQFLDDHNEYKELILGAERIKSNQKLKTEEMAALEGDNLAKYGPYVCTGYDVYLLKEPCLMCAMALVHSRAKRVFFVEPSSNGSFLTRFKLQGVPELNHHYEVYQLQYDDNEIISDNKS